jgi:DTW domain-containing protein YfiP
MKVYCNKCGLKKEFCQCEKLPVQEKTIKKPLKSKKIIKKG